MTGELGIWQHATGPAPNLAFGYCTDDVARALTVDLAHARMLGWDAVAESARRSLRFMRDAFDPATGRFRNFRDEDGRWLDEEASDDSYGRAMLALGGSLGGDHDEAFTAGAMRLFAAALPASARVTALRATASTLLGCAAALESPGVDDELRAATSEALWRLAARLRRAFAPVASSGDWPWPEPVLTYENPLLPRALIVAGQRMGDHALIGMGLHVLDWLIVVQTSNGGEFSAIGSEGFWPRGGRRARFDQQPIEATAMILAAETALAHTGESALSRRDRARLRVVPGRQRHRPGDGRSDDGRLLRRPRACQREPQPGRGVDPHVVDRARARPRDPARDWHHGSDPTSIGRLETRRTAGTMPVISTSAGSREAAASRG